MNWMIRLATVAGLLLPGTESAAQESLSLENYIKKDEIGATVENWQKAIGQYYGTLYSTSFNVEVTKGAKDEIVTRYDGRTLPSDLSKLEPNVVRGIVRNEVEDLLYQSLTKTPATSKYQTFRALAVDIAGGKVKEVTIDKDSVDKAIEAQDCDIIPCDPKKCDPNSCARAAVKQSVPSGQ